MWIHGEHFRAGLQIRNNTMYSRNYRYQSCLKGHCLYTFVPMSPCQGHMFHRRLLPLHLLQIQLLCDCQFWWKWNKPVEVDCLQWLAGLTTHLQTKWWSRNISSTGVLCTIKLIWSVICMKSAILVNISSQGNKQFLEGKHVELLSMENMHVILSEHV